MVNLSRDSKDPAVQRLIRAKDKKWEERTIPISPSHLLLLARDHGFFPNSSVAWDTETSGLFADDGARVSTTSVAWVDVDRQWGPDRFEGLVWQVEEIVPGYEVPIASIAWPFDQGTEGKPESHGQGTLWPEADNLDLDEWIALLDWLEFCGEQNGLDAHNAKFDLEKMRVGVRRWPGVGRELEHLVVWDSQNVNDLLWRLHPTSLKPTCARLFGKEWADEGEIVKKYLAKAKLPAGRWDLMPWDAIGKYAETDARITCMLKLRQIWEIYHNTAGNWLGGVQDVLDKVDRRHEYMKVLYRMERRGVPYDEVMSREAAIECRKRATPIMHQLPFRPTIDAAKEYFFTDNKVKNIDRKVTEGLNMIPYAVTEKGAPQLTAEIVLRMIDDRVPFADKWGEFSRVDNAASMWYEGYADKIGLDGRLRTAFRQNGTRSSRVSAERVNLQAIPQDYRLSEFEILSGIPTPREIIAHAVSLLTGWRLFELDLAQAELRVATMFAKCKLMDQMIRDGEDLHTFTTKALFPKEDPEGPLFKSKWRQVGKRGNFSLCFGSKGKTFKGMVSKETGILLSEPEADRIVRDWNYLYPEFSAAITKHQNVVVKRQNRHGYGWIDLVNGERRWFQEYEEAHKAFNQRVQANLGQFAIDWTLLTDEYLRTEVQLNKQAEKDGIGEAGLVLTIHDSQVLLLPDNDYGEALAAKCADFGRGLWDQFFPDIPGDVDYHQWDYT